MELKSTHFDMTDPFARPTHLAGEAERRLLAMPAARRQEILAEYLPPVTVEPPRSIYMPVATTRFPVEERRPPQAEPTSMPTVIFRPRRIQRPLSRKEWLLLVALRLTLSLRREARKQFRLKLKATRRFLRRVLPRRKPMRGRTAR